MNIEEAINYYLELKPCKNWIESVEPNFFFEFAETVITAYEKKCKELKKEIQDDLDVRNRWGLTLQELEKEKEKNKELEKKLDEISEIHFPTIY